MKRLSKHLEKLSSYSTLIVLSILTIIPILVILLAAFQTPDELTGGFSFPSRLYLGNFARVWKAGNFGRATLSSTIVTVPTVIFSTLFSILAGYAFGTMQFKGSAIIFNLFITGIIMPYEAMVVPLYFDLRPIGLTDNYWGVILPSIASSVAFGTFWMRAFFLTAPRELIEYAKISGANSWTILWKILVPIAKPSIFTMVVLIFMWTWNDFLLSLVMLSNPSIQTSALKLAMFQGRRLSDITGLATGAIIVAFPVVLLYIFFQRHFIRGFLSGSIKA